MSIQDEIKPNTPYMVRVNGDGDAEVKAVFSATDFVVGCCRR